MVTLKPVSVRDYLQALYLLNLIQTGSHDDAGRRTRLGVEQWAEVRPHAWDDLLRDAVNPPAIGPAPQTELSGWTLRLHALPEPERSILTLFYAELLPLPTLAGLFRFDLHHLAGYVAKGRRDLGFDPGGAGGLQAGSSSAPLDALDCPFYHAAILSEMTTGHGPDQKAARIARAGRQRRFDEPVCKALREHRPDPAYLASLSGLLEPQAGAGAREGAAVPRPKNAHFPANASSGTGAPAQRSQLERPNATPAGVVEDDPADDDPENEPPRHAHRFTILTAIGIGLIGTIAIGWFIISEQINSFSGSERVSELLDSANGLNGDEFDPVNVSAKDLEDYFFLKHGLEHYSVPKELGDLKAIGCRVAKVDGADVAEIMAVDAKEMLLFLFQPRQLGVKIKPGRWEIIQGENWVGGLNGDKDVCCMVAFHGTRDDMKAFLHSADKR